MSHSVTTTASYLLNRYSRSYPPTAPSVRAPEQVEHEWEHFTNPVLRIVLEAKKSLSGKLDSMRLKILWSLRTVPDNPHTDQTDVVFEDLELLSFSSLPTFHLPGAQPDQSLPLKAVYRDAVVGIRYLHPRIVPPGSQPTYRRFQVTFRDAQNASQFIDAVKSVCPCKANPYPTHLNQHPTMSSASLMRTTTAMPGHPPAPLQPARLAESQSMMSAPIEPRRVAPVPHRPPDNQSFSIASSSMATSVSSDDSAFVTCTETSYRADAQVDRRRDDLPMSSGHGTVPSSLPGSSQPSSSGQSASMPPPPVPRRVAHESTDAMSQEPLGTVNVGGSSSQVVTSLSEHPSLYDMPKAELEVVIGQVIREEGFLQLLETLDSMWQVKGLLGR